MQIIDAHCHFWRLDRGDYGWLAGVGGPLAPLRRDYLPTDYPGEARLIVVQAAPTLAETLFLLELAAQDPRIAGVVGWVDLTAAGAVAELGLLAAHPAFKGVRPMLQDIAATDWLITAPRPDAVAALTRLGLRFDALVTPRHLAMLDRFAAANPDLPLVIDHAAKPLAGDLAQWSRDMTALARHRHVHCKLSGLLTELPPAVLTDPLPALRAVFDPLLDAFGPDRLIWGSDWPVLTLATSHADWLALTEVLLAGLTPAERAAIMGGNAARFYGVAA